MDLVDGAMLFEQILKIVLRGLKREITYVQFHCVLNLEKLPSYRAVPGDRFQTTNEQRSSDDLTWSEAKQRNPIGMDYRADHAEHKFPGAPSAGFDCHSSSFAFLLFYQWKMGRANSTRFFLLPFNF